MVLNLISGFIMPWLVCSWLYKRERNVVQIITPFVVLLSFTINILGNQFGFWILLPIFEIKSLSALPFILGLYPVFASYMIFFIKAYKKSLFWILLFSFGTTFLELLLLLNGRIIYGNGWNIFLTFISYLVPYYVTYLFYNLAKTYKFRNHNS